MALLRIVACASLLGFARLAGQTPGDTVVLLKDARFTGARVATGVNPGVDFPQPYQYSFPDDGPFVGLKVEMTAPSAEELGEAEYFETIRLKGNARASMRLTGTARSGGSISVTYFRDGCTQELRNVPRDAPVSLTLSCPIDFLPLSGGLWETPRGSLQLLVRVGNRDTNFVFTYEFTPRWGNWTAIKTVSPERSSTLPLGKSTIRATVEWESRFDTNLELRLYWKRSGSTFPQLRERSGLVKIKQGKGSTDFEIRDFEIRPDVDIEEIVVIAGFVYSGEIAIPLSETSQVRFGVASFTPVDLAIDRVQAVQVVQDEQDSIPLIPLKSTMVRVLTKSLGANAKRIDGVFGTIRAEGQSAVVTAQNAYGAFAETTEPSLEDRSRSLNFILPLEWTKAGTLKLSIEVNSGDPDSKPDNNKREIELFFDGKLVPSAPVLISLFDAWRAFVNAEGKTELLMPESSINQAWERTRAILPVGEDRHTFVHTVFPATFPAINTQADLEKFGGLWTTLSRILKQAYGRGKVFRSYAAIRTPERDVIPRQSGLDVFVAVKVMRAGGITGDCIEWLTQPERGGCVKFVQRLLETVALYSFTVKHDELGGATSAFNGSSGLLEDPAEWISPAQYLALLANIQGEAAFNASSTPLADETRNPEPPTPGGDGNGGSAGRSFALETSAATPVATLLISGEIQSDGSNARLDPAIRLPASTPDANDPNGEYCLVATRGSGSSDPVCFPIPFSERTGLGFFALEIAASGDLTKVALIRKASPERELASLAESGSAAVRFLTPAANDVLEGSRLVSWVATGPAAPQLSYTLMYSVDDGATWLPAALNIKQTSFNFDSGALENGKSVRLRLLASGGLAGAAVELGPLEVRQRPRMEVPVKIVSFGNRTLGEHARADVTVRNAGSGMMTVTPEIPAGDPFALSGGAAVTVPGGGERKVAVFFRPPSAGTFQSTLRLTAAGVTETVVLEGAAYATPQPAIETPATLDFGRVAAGATKDLTLTIRNTGRAGLTVQAIRSGSSAFVVSGFTAPLQIAAGAQSSVTVRASVAIARLDTSTLTILNSDPSRPVMTVALSVDATRQGPSIDVAPSSLDFGSVNVNGTRDLTLTVANRGGAALNVTGITSSNARFSVVTATPFNVAAGAQASVTVRFSPNAAGAQSGNLTIASNDSARASVVVAVSGTGGAAGAGPSINVTPASLEFGNVNVNATRDLAVTIANRGTSALNVTAITSSNARFTIAAGGAPFTVAAGSQSTVSVRFSPNAAGAQAGNLTIASNDTVRGPVTVPVTGTGTATGGGPSIEVTPSSVDFGSVNVNATHGMAITVANRGAAALNVTAITLSNARFSIVSGGAPFTVAAGSQSTVNVRFSPNAPGTQTGTLTIASNDPSRASVTVSLTGVGVAATGGGPSIDVSPASLDFGNVNAGSTRDIAFTVTNRGTAPLNVTAITSSNARFTVVSGGAPFSVNAGGQSAVTVRFSPNAAGSQTGTLTIASNDPVRAAATVPLTGVGTGAAGPRVLQIDDGTFERTMGAPGADIFFVNRLTPDRYPATLRAVRIYFHAEDAALEEGTGISIVSGANTSGGSNINPPNVRLQGAVGRSGRQGAFAEFPVNPITIQSGDFVVGFNLNNPAGVLPMANDTSSTYQARSYVSFDGNTFQLIDTVQNVTKGNFLIRAVVD